MIGGGEGGGRESEDEDYGNEGWWDTVRSEVMRSEGKRE